MQLLNGKVINFSDTTLWVIETTTNHPHGPPIAHKLHGKRKSPHNIDAGSYKVDKDENWEEELRLVTAIYKSKGARKTSAYEVSGMGSVDKQTALEMAEAGELDNVVIAQNGKTRYLRTKPDKTLSNNLKEIILA